MTRVTFLGKAVALLPFLLTTTFLFGQAVNYAQIQGRVIDATGAMVANVKLDAVGTATGLVRSVTSGADGNYSIPNLPVGSYELRVSGPGFRQYIQKGIVLQVGESPTINVTLQVGTTSETLEVTANAAMVETHENSISTMIDNTRIMEMPLDGRNAPALVLLSGAAANISLPSQDLNSTKNYGNNNQATSAPSQTISVGGGQENANNYLLDGGDNNDAFSNINNPFPFPDAIQEFNVQSSGLSARFGVHAGAVVNVVTKSGTNLYHGNVFGFLRNPIVNAKHKVLLPPTPNFRDAVMKRGQYGGTFGGPVIKDKLMFFVGFQGTRQQSTPAPSAAKVPTSAVLAGDWTAFTTTRLKAPFVNNRIDPALYNPQALALLKFIPVATDPQGNIGFTVPSVFNEDQGIARLDWNVNSKNSFFSRYFATDSRSPVPFDAGNILPQGIASGQFARYQSLALGETSSFGPRVVNSVHGTLTRLAINRGPANQMITPATVGINVPSPIAQGMVLSVASGYFTVGGGGSMPGYFINNLYQIADDVDVVVGRHQLSFGVNFMKMQLNYLSTFQSNGQFNFNAGSAIAGDNLADFMLGRVNNFTQGNPEAENWRYTYTGLYAHDNIRLSPKLTINVGVRWEPYMPSKDAKDRGSHFDYPAFLAGTHSTVFPNAPAGMFFCGDQGIPCAYAHSKMAQFSPRAGLIWDPTGEGRTTIRAGFGLFYDSPEMYYFDRYADNSPYGAAVSFTRPVGGLTDPYQGQTTIKFPTPFPTPGSPDAIFPQNAVTINNSLDVHPMYVEHWNLSLQQQLGANWVVSATYLGNKTTHVWSAYEANPGLNVPVPAAVATSVPGCSTFTGTSAAPSTANVNCRRALVIANPAQGQFFSNLTSLWDGADAGYHAMLLSARHRFSNNFTLLTNYTYSHCISDQDFTGELTNSRPTLFPSPITDPNFNNLALDRGNCGFDIRHSVNGSLVIVTPKFHSGLTRTLFNNWQLAPLLTYRTGSYFTVTTGRDTALLGATNNFKDRPNQVGNPFQGSCTFVVSGVSQTVPVGGTGCWFNNTSSVFTLPANGQFGNVRRNSLAGPNAFTFDTAVSRKLALTESKELQLRFEAFNILNHPVLSNPVSNMNDANFGKITNQIGDGRTFQAAVKFAF